MKGSRRWSSGESRSASQRLIVYNDRAADTVAVSVQILGGAVDDDVRAELKRVLKVRTHERIVHNPSSGSFPCKTPRNTGGRSRKASDLSGFE